MSVLSPTLKVDAAVVVVVSEEELLRAAAAGDEREEDDEQGGRDQLLHDTPVSEVLDSGTKTVSDFTRHSVVGVVLRVQDGRLESLTSGVTAPPRRDARGSARACGRRGRARAPRAARDAPPP